MSANIEIRKVLSKKDLASFINLPFTLYHNDPYWIPPVISDMENIFNPKMNPLFENTEVQLFIALNGDKMVGRVAGMINYRNNELHSEKTVFFGYFESVNDVSVAEALLKSVEEWGNEKGMSTLRGPYSFTTADEAGLLVEGFDSCPMIHMPYNPFSYIKLLDAAGLKKERDIVAYHLDVIKDIPGKLRESVEKIGFRSKASVRSLDMKNYKQEMMTILDIYNKAWTDNWKFVPMTEKEMQHFSSEIRTFLIPELVTIMEMDGKPVGFAFALPDLSQAFRHLEKGRLFPLGIFKLLYFSKKITAIRMIRIGLLKEFRVKGLEAVLFLHMWEAAKKLGYIDAELSWISEDDLALRRSVEGIGAKTYKRYRLYSKKNHKAGDVMYTIKVTGSFSAAHFLRNYKGKCENMHGHNWKVFVEMEGTKLDEAGMLIDFGIVKTQLKEVLEHLDHKVLNEEVEFFKAHNTSAEHIARYIFEMMQTGINHPHAKVSAVTVYETETSACTYKES